MGDQLLSIVVAAFPNRERAQRAAKELHAAGFDRQWLGATEADEPGRAQALNPAERASRWLRFAGDEDLADALREHGVDDADARRIARTIPPGRAIVIAASRVPGSDGAAIVERNDGIVFELFGPQPGGEG